jgi:hypothetical protein
MGTLRSLPHLLQVSPAISCISTPHCASTRDYIHSSFSIDVLLLVMPSYCTQDCHYFYRTALRGLNISTTVSPLYA